MGTMSAGEAWRLGLNVPEGGTGVKCQGQSWVNDAEDKTGGGLARKHISILSLPPTPLMLPLTTLPEPHGIQRAATQDHGR